MESTFNSIAESQETVVTGDIEVVTKSRGYFGLTPGELQEIRANLPAPFNAHTGVPVRSKDIRDIRSRLDAELLKSIDVIMRYTPQGNMTTVLSDRVKYLDSFRVGVFTTIFKENTGVVPDINLSRKEAMIALDMVEMARNVYG